MANFVQLILEHPVECEQASTVYAHLNDPSVSGRRLTRERYHMIAKRQHRTDTNRI